MQCYADLTSTGCSALSIYGGHGDQGDHIGAKSHFLSLNSIEFVISKCVSCWNLSSTIKYKRIRWIWTNHGTSHVGDWILNASWEGILESTVHPDQM